MMFDSNCAFHVVEFHADGGQACTFGRRIFDNVVEAEHFEKRMRNEPDHLCGPESVKTFSTEERKSDSGEIYPNVASSVRIW